MAVCINSAALDGIDALIIHIETKITPGMQYFIVGLAGRIRPGKPGPGRKRHLFSRPAHAASKGRHQHGPCRRSKAGCPV